MSDTANKRFQKKQLKAGPSDVFKDFLFYMVEEGERYPVGVQDLWLAWGQWHYDWMDANKVALTKRRLEGSWVVEAWMETLGYRTTNPSAENGWRREHEEGEMSRWKNISWK